MSDPTRVLTQSVVIPVGATGRMGGYLARPDRPGAAPGVLVGMELFGVSAHVRDVCDRLAALGYTALAPDFYHRTAPGTELPADDAGRARGFELLHQLTRAQALQDVTAARDWLRTRSPYVAGMVGLSVGGHLAYLAATALDLPAVAVAYGGWIPTTDIPLSRPEPTLTRTGTITGQVLLLVGEDDPLIPGEHRQQLTAALTLAGVSHQLITYPDTGHGFLCDRRDSYHAPATADAWQRIEQLLSPTHANTTSTA